jgi:hypothetical protein
MMARLFFTISASILVAVLVLGAGSTLAADVQVMTQNQYLGANLAPVLQAAADNDPIAFNAAIIKALGEIAANRPVERMAAQAALIDQRRPLFVALQESYIFACTDPTGAGRCANPAIAGAFSNYLDLTLAALHGAYAAAATVVNLDVVVPVYVDASSYPILLSVVDRDVILKRAGTAAAPVDFGCIGFESGNGCNYQVALPAGPFVVRRGYVGIDTNLDGADYRIVNTHLEVKDAPIPPEVQSAQAFELTNVLMATPSGRSLIVMGDLNSSPEDALPLPYAQFVALGYTDTWLLRPGNVTGQTCCQAENLANRQSALSERVDMIFTYEPPAGVKQARVLGDTVSAKTRPHGLGLWASDHGAVAVGLQF